MEEQPFLDCFFLNVVQGSTGLAYTLVDGAVAWEREPVRMTANEALAAELTDTGERTERDDARGWLEKALADSPMPAKETIRQAKENGIAERTLRRAKNSLRVETHREGFGPGAKWLWRLPDDHRRPAESIGGHPKDVAIYAASGHLCGTEDGGHAEGAL